MRKTMPKLRIPNTREISLEMTVLVSSLTSSLQHSWSRSVMNTAERLLRPLLTVLRAPLEKNHFYRNIENCNDVGVNIT